MPVGVPLLIKAFRLTIALFFLLKNRWEDEYYLGLGLLKWCSLFIFLV